MTSTCLPSPTALAPTFEFKQFYLACLAQASYLLGSNGEAAIVDPRRDVSVYIEEAKARGLTIRYVIETHLHADFVSGHKELSERTGAPILISRKANALYEHRGVDDGDEVRVGALSLRILETPGHTPESISILVTDTSVSEMPRMVLTGDTLFIGDVGRPDLLGSKGLTADHMAGLMYDSLHTKLLPLADDVLVYPAHGAGSLCGKNLSKETFATMGTQRATNVALQPMSRDEFIRFLTADAPETPRYFPMDVEINRQGAASLGRESAPESLTVEAFVQRKEEGAVILDVRPSADYAIAHIPRSMNIGLGGQFASWAGTLLDPKRDILIVAESESDALEARTRLARVGLERTVGWLADGMNAWKAATLPVEAMQQLTVFELHALLTNPGPRSARPVQVVDVRRNGEWQAGHIAGALHAPLHQLEDHAAYLDPTIPTYVMCGGGYRSVMATEILQEMGVRQVIDVKGGMAEWNAQGLPTVTP
ncbi:MAG: MBL fold metallo-hydrolase [Vicinamibacteria bacterium]